MSRFGLGFLPHGGGNDQYTKILLHMDGTNGGTSFPDVNVGGSAHTWTAHSATTVTSGQKFGTAIMQSPYIDTPASSDFNLGTRDWTIDFWFDMLGLGAGTNRAIAGQVPGGLGPASNTSFFLVFLTTNKIRLTTSDGTTNPLITGSTAITAAGLHHLEICRTGNFLQMYLDGVKDATDVSMSGTIPSSSAKFAVGRAGEDTTNPSFAGLIDEFRLSVGIARHTANFTPPTSAYS